MAMPIDCTITLAAVWHNGQPARQQQCAAHQKHHVPYSQILRSCSPSAHTVERTDPLQKGILLSRVSRLVEAEYSYQ